MYADPVEQGAINPNETRQPAAMRRSGAIECDAGGGDVADQSNRVADSIAVNKRLRKTCHLVNLASVRRFDQARVPGADKLKEKRPD